MALTEDLNQLLKCEEKGLVQLILIIILTIDLRRFRSVMAMWSLEHLDGGQLSGWIGLESNPTGTDVVSLSKVF